MLCPYQGLPTDSVKILKIGTSKIIIILVIVLKMEQCSKDSKRCRWNGPGSIKNICGRPEMVFEQERKDQ